MERFFQPASGAKSIELAYVSMEAVTVDMRIGVSPNEQDFPQRVTIDVKVGFPDSRTHIADSISGLQDGFDYSAVHQCIMESTTEPTNLLETLANRIAEKVLRLPHALTCEVTVTKSRVWANVGATRINIFRKAK